MTKTLCTLFIALLALSANNAFAQSAEQYSPPKWLYKHTTASGRVVTVERLSDKTGDTERDSHYMLITIDRDSVMSRPNRIPDSSEYAWEAYWDIPKQYPAIVALFDKVMEDDPKLLLTINRYASGEIERCLIEMECSVFARHSLEDFGQIFDALDRMHIIPSVYNCNRDIADRKTAGHSFRMGIRRHKSDEEHFNELSNLLLDTVIGSYRIKVPKHTELIKTDSVEHRYYSIRIRHIDAKSSASTPFCNPHCREMMPRIAHDPANNYFRNIGIIMSEVPFPNDVYRLLYFYVNDRIDAARIIVDTQTYSKTPIEKWINIIRRLSFPKLSENYPYPDCADELVYGMSYNMHRGERWTEWGQNYQEGYYEPNYKGVPRPQRYVPDHLHKKDTSIVVSKREVRSTWIEDEKGVVKTYRIDVICKPNAKPINREANNAQQIREEHALRKRVDHEQVCEIFRRCLNLSAEKKDIAITVKVQPSGKVHSYAMVLNSGSHCKNTPKDYARVIGQLNRAKLFPAWRDAYPYDSVEHGYNYYVNIDHKTN